MEKSQYQMLRSVVPEQIIFRPLSNPAVQGRSNVFQGGVAEVYIPHVVSGGMLPQENFEARRSLLTGHFSAPYLICSAPAAKTFARRSLLSRDA